MTDTAETAPEANSEPGQPADNSQAVADAVAEKSGQASETDYGFVLDKYRADGRTDQEAAFKQAEAYKELHSKFGAFTGAPEEYELALSESMSEKINLDDFADDPILDKAKVMAKEMGINNDGFNKLTELYFEGQLADQDAIEQVRAEEMQLLGKNADRRLQNIQDWAKFNLDQETSTALEGVMTSAAGVQAIEALIAKTRNAPQVNDTTPAEVVSHDKLREMMSATDQYGNPKMNDPEYRKEVNRLYGQRFGEEPQNVTVGV